MTPRYTRVPPDRAEEARAAIVSAALGVGVGLVTFYLARLFLSREAMESMALEEADSRVPEPGS